MSADALSRMLSESWNHSDDEMYYCGYWGLYRYAFNDTLRAKYKEAIIDHWETERPEKEGLWNILDCSYRCCGFRPGRGNLVPPGVSSGSDKLDGQQQPPERY